MVAPADQRTGEAPWRRLVRMVDESGLPGDRGDYEWIARRIWSYAEKTGVEDARKGYVADMMLTALFLERGIDPSAVPQLQGREFPDHSLRAVPELLKRGCPESVWPLLESGVLSFERPFWLREGVWVIQGTKLTPLVAEWHEIGEQIVLHRIAKRLRPLFEDPGPSPQFKLTGVTKDQGRQWLFLLKSSLHRLGAGSRMCFMLSPTA